MTTIAWCVALCLTGDRQVMTSWPQDASVSELWRISPSPDAVTEHTMDIPQLHDDATREDMDTEVADSATSAPAQATSKTPQMRVRRRRDEDRLPPAVAATGVPAMLIQVPGGVPQVCDTCPVFAVPRKPSEEVRVPQALTAVVLFGCRPACSLLM